jgi:arsenate reductase
VNVLFVCHDNCALSLMAESILNSVGPTLFHGFSAGALRTAAINQDLIEFLSLHHMPVSGLRSKTLDSFRRAEAPRMDFIITLCESAADQVADWPGHPFVAHWNVETDDVGGDADVALRDSFWTLMRRIKIFTSLPHGKLSRRVLEQRARTLEASYL